MKLFGYASSDSEQQVPWERPEVTLSASATELREIAGFLLQAAGTMERMCMSFDHLHLSDSLRQFANSPAMIVASASEES